MTKTLHICSFESRKSVEMRSLIERNGAKATVVPSMRELPLDDNPSVFEFASAVVAGKIDVVIFMTGVGARRMAESLQSLGSIDEFFLALAKCVVIVRGPKPAVVLREWKVPVHFRAAEPNTWRELLEIIDTEVPIAGKTVAVQEYGRISKELHQALEARGANVVSVPVYRWALPEDVGPLKDAVRDTIHGDFDVLMFTSANQLTNILTVAAAENLRERWIEAAQQCVIASIGPTASEMLRDAGLSPEVEASPPKMGQLVRQTVQSTPDLMKNRKAVE